MLQFMLDVVVYNIPNVIEASTASLASVYAYAALAIDFIPYTAC